ncbi:MAG: hypothetical protein ACREOK_15360 [Gemmatimonadaceae bacterium]
MTMRTMRLAAATAALLTGLAHESGAQAPEWNAFVNVRPDPSPYIADWESDPSIVTLVLSYSGSANVAFHLNGRILRGGAAVINGVSTPFEFVRPSQLLLSTRDGIWDRNSVTYTAALRDQIERTGRIPDGEYQFCVTVRQGLPESPGAQLANECASFSITAPQPPSLIAPFDTDTIRVPRPTFVWSPVMLGPGNQVNYHLRVTPMLPGQAPLEALNNVPQYEADVTTTTVSYPSDALPLDDSTRYVWQVQAIDAAGQPVGERQGKSEAWTFAKQSPMIVAAAPVADTASDEIIVASLRWGGMDVKVLSISDSSPNNFSGRGRVKIIPGVFEPSFRFKSLHLDSARSRVLYGPRHVINVPLGDGILDYPLKALPVPFYVNLKRLVFVADSGGEQYAGLSGTASLFVGFGIADSIGDAGSVQLAAGAECPEMTMTESGGEDLEGNVTPITVDTVHHRTTVCRIVNDVKAIANDSASKEQLLRVLAELRDRSLYFAFENLGIASGGPRGTLRLLRDFSSGVFGLDNAKLTLAADSTTLTLADGGGQLDLQGTFRFPPGVGLIKDKPDTIWKDTTKKEVKSLDSTITVRFARARLGTDGEVLLATDGIPKARIGQTGLRLQSGNAWVDLSGSASPSGKENGWRGVFFDSVRVFLPSSWNAEGTPPPAKGESGNVQIAGYKLAVDGNGLSGLVVGSQLERLGAVGFGGFSGRLDSLRLEFASGNLEEGYVEGILRAPFLEGDLPYLAVFNANGVERAYAKITEPQRIAMPALGGDAVIQRGELLYDDQVGTLKVDAKLSIAREGIALREAQVYGLAISSEGRLTLGSGWLALDQGNEAGFGGFPVAVDSIGFGSGANGNEVWLGVAGRFSLNDNLPASAGAFRVFAKRDAPGASWRFDRLAVDRLDVNFENAAVAFRGGLEYVQNDSVYGNAFKAAVRMAVQNQFSVDGTFIAGSTLNPNRFRYWYVDARLVLPPPGIQLGPLPLAIWGFAGGAYSRMVAVIDTNTLKATYRPDSTNNFGLKAAVSIGTSANSGYIWNADTWLEASVNMNGGLDKLTLRGDHWMLTEVAKREKKLWGTVFIDLPVSKPVLHANLVANVDLKPALKGSGWAELHFEPSSWYINVGTPQKPDSLTLLPSTLNLKSTAFFQMDRDRVYAGMATHFDTSKRVSIFRGSVDAGYEASAELRYRPFQVMGEGELWGEVSAEVKALDKWWEIFSGELRSSMAFRFPDPMGVWGRIRFRYRFASGTVKGTYRMRYKWGDVPGSDESESDSFVLVAATYPLSGDTAAPLSGMTYYLGMTEGSQYGTDDGVFRLRLSGTPVLEQEVPQTRTIRDRSGGITTRTAPAWQSIGVVIRDWQEERTTLVVKAPGYATLNPATKYRARATFVLEKQSGNDWVVQQTVNSIVEFRTTGFAPILAQLVTETDPRGGATPLYFGGPNAGAIRVQFSNTHPDLTSGAVRAVLVANGTDSVPGAWATHSYPYAAVRRTTTTDPTLYAFRPAAAALTPSTSYRFALVNSDTSAREHYAVSFVTSAYATLFDHVNTSTQTITPTRGPGPLSGSGNYLQRVRIALAGPEPMTWTDIDSIEVVGLSGWTVIPRTRCQWAGGTAPTLAVTTISKAQACRKPAVYENILDVRFAAESDAALPVPGTSSITVRLNHRREGWRSFTFTIPPEAPLVVTAAPTVVNTAPTVATPPPTVDITGIGMSKRKP